MILNTGIVRQIKIILTYQTKPTILSLPNITHRTKHTKSNLLNKTLTIKPEPTNQTLQTEPDTSAYLKQILSQTYQPKRTKQLVVGLVLLGNYKH